MRVGGVRSGYEDTIRGVDIGITRRGRIGAQCRLVTGDRRRHAQTRIRVDVIGADEAFRELVEDVIVFGQQLT